MAQMFPNTLVGSVPPATMRVFTRLKRLPDEHFHVWQRLAVWSEAGPDFWLLRGDGRSLLLTVASVTRRDVQQWQQPAIQETLFAPRAEVPPPGAAEQAALPSIDHATMVIVSFEPHSGTIDTEHTNDTHASRHTRSD